MLFAFELVQHHEVEQRVVHRDRDVILDLIPERARKLCLVHLRDVHLANDDALVGDPDGDPLAFELSLLPEVSDHRRDGLGVGDLSAHDRARRKRQLREPDEDARIRAADLCSANGAGADIETDGCLCHREGSLRCSSRGPLYPRGSCRRRSRGCDSSFRP